MCLCICLFVQLVVIFSTVFKSTYITLIVVLKNRKNGFMYQLHCLI